MWHACCDGLCEEQMKFCVIFIHGFVCIFVFVYYMVMIVVQEVVLFKKKKKKLCSASVDIW